MNSGAGAAVDEPIFELLGIDHLGEVIYGFVLRDAFSVASR